MYASCRVPSFGAAVLWLVLGAVPEEFALFAKVAKSIVYRNHVSYDSLSLVHSVVRLQ